MAELGRSGESGAVEPDSKRSLWRYVRRLFDGGLQDQSLRAHLEEVIDEHEDGGTAAADAAGDLSGSERQMLRNLLHFSELNAADVAIPRGSIIGVPHNASWVELVAAFAEHGHSRLPVYRETMDEIIGMMLIKDVFPFLAKGEVPATHWTRLMRQPLFVPCPRRAIDVLADMRGSRVHLAVVVDEYSGTEGIITIEDLVEEIVGEIEDEHDDAPVERLRALPDGSWEADARVELDEVAQRIDPDLADTDEDIDTLGGLAFLLAGHVPPVGTTIPHGSGWTIEVTGADERHITTLRLLPPEDPAPKD
ncbi:CBS domain-containing protein [Novosphingobium sp. FSY-8]|uniref:CBS domain-containing protein n=1 Tax=Novosphingobium ovatum TaxID=1908523 RepID=A0ABW9XBE2_9SPHN|nr:hemolysin family protein [Novosphingobium ovatum]NBC35860.1 CBS domain-containing protein [Novosphingobium ovatum]